jgi:hypothetical protein
MVSFARWMDLDEPAGLQLLYAATMRVGRNCLQWELLHSESLFGTGRHASTAALTKLDLVAGQWTLSSQRLLRQRASWTHNLIS